MTDNSIYFETSNLNVTVVISLYKISPIQKIALLVVAIWFLVQIVVVFLLNDMIQWPDSRLNYMPNSLWHFEHGTFYPDSHNLYDIFIQSIGYVNFLVVLLHLFGSFKGAMMVNVIMNVGVVACIYYLGKKFFNQKVASIAVILYCLLLSNLFIPVYIMSDLPSLFSSLLGFCFVLKRKVIFIFLGGLLIGYAHTVRSYEIAFVLPLLYYMVKNKFKWFTYIFFLISYLGVIHSTGLYSKHSTGTYVTSATTNGFGLVKIALGNGRGDVGNNIFSDSTNSNYQGLPNTYTFAQKDSIWKERAKPGLRKNALLYMLYFPARVKKLFLQDSFFIPEPYRFNKSSFAAINKASPFDGIYRFGLMYNNLVYYIIIICFLFSLFVCRKNIFTQRGVLLAILLIMVFGFAGYIAEERYHYPCIFILCLWGAFGLDTILRRKILVAKNNH